MATPPDPSSLVSNGTDTSSSSAAPNYLPMIIGTALGVGGIFVVGCIVYWYLRIRGIIKTDIEHSAATKVRQAYSQAHENYQRDISARSSNTHQRP